MGHPLEGAKQARKAIQRSHGCLNAAHLVPEQCYRRNHGTYPLVQYVNQITGLFLSQNYRVIPVFLGRALREFGQVRHDLVSEPYRKVVLAYLRHMAQFVDRYAELAPDDLAKTMIPAELLASGEPEPAPLPFGAGEP